MKKFLIFAVAVQMLSACFMGNEAKEEAMQKERDSLQRIINEKDLELNDIMGTINVVQEGISRINEAEGRVTVADGSRESASSKEVIRENMAFIQEVMQQNRDMIAQLKDKLKKSGIQAEKLNKTIENLQAQVESQHARIQELEAELAEKDILITEQGKQIADLHRSASELAKENKDKARTMAAQEKELNAGWFVFGTKNELKEQKIIEDGEVLRGDFNKGYFTKIDIRYDRTIRLYSKNAKVLTNHPADSYSLEKNDEGLYELYVKDIEKFWGASKYLVIQVK
ncbi:MAG: hypothetical protein IKT30_01415 [Bacteroidaceae bacterium]|nr:hypothetical protein [Bacteroidaceae bacterium]